MLTGNMVVCSAPCICMSTYLSAALEENRLGRLVNDRFSVVHVHVRYQIL